MRKYFVMTCAAVCLLAFGASGFAATTVRSSKSNSSDKQASSISALLAQFPNGGPGLRAAIARAVEADPSLADAVVAAALKAKPEQKRAMGAGLADAADYFAKIGLDWARGAETSIRNAMLRADQDTRIGFELGSAPTLVQGIPGFSNAGARTHGCRVSPSGPFRPVPGCE
jgi:hypothetical protein